MGRPTAPIPLLLLLLRPAAPSPPCFAVPTGAPTELDLANSSRRCPELDWGPFQLQRRLLLSHNGIEGLSPAARAGPALEELDLSHNRLRELPAAFLSQARGLRRLRLQHNRLRTLPAGFFADATALQSLHLEGNPLSAVPPSAFQPHLLHLDVPCRCDAVGSVLAPCACSNCTAPRCRCLDSHEDFVNVTDFHARHCWGGVGLVAGSAVAAVAVAVLLVVVATVCYRRRKMATGTAGAGWGKWEPAAAYGQPRYISRATEIGAADAAAAATATAAPDYENVFVSPGTATAAARGWTLQWQEKRYSPPGAADADYFLESEADAAEQPIYANTQTLAQDDIYIVPNQ